MRWNIAPECVSAIILCIILIYSRCGTPIPNLKNKLFQACLMITFYAIAANIASTLLIELQSPALLPLTWCVTILYFWATPLMGLMYFSYILANVYEDPHHAKRKMLQYSIPGLIYGLLVLFTPMTNHIFVLTSDGHYVQGPLIFVTYLIFYLYCLFSVSLVLCKWRQILPTLRSILIFFPLLAGVVIIIQLIFPDIVLSGSAATCAMLLIYLFLQNKQLAIDSLTGLPHRQEFMKMLELNIRRPTDATFVVVVLSLRDFKLVNDSHGQHSGDTLLAAVSGFLKCELGLHEHQLYRYSGDEFAIVLDAKSMHSVKRLTAKICVRMAQPWETTACTCLLSCAVGVVTYPTDASTVEGLINGIESTISLAKTQSNMNHICYCDATLLEQSKRRQQISTILKETLQSGDFEIYYQPIVEVATGRFTLAEALLRLNHTSIGPISPNEFIPIAEEGGLIVELTYLVLDKVCACIRRVLDAGLILDGVNVNFSPAQFTQPDLVERISEIIAHYDFPFSKIKVEITESTLAENPEVVADFMCRLHEYGIRIGLDDFGTGYSNLSSVTNLPLDVIKLDKSLVWSAMTNRRTAIIVQNLSHAFGELGLTVLAEGVETEEQSRFVVDCGCALIQGFLYAQPMEESQFLTFLASHMESVPD